MDKNVLHKALKVYFSRQSNSIVFFYYNHCRSSDNSKALYLTKPQGALNIIDHFQYFHAGIMILIQFNAGFLSFCFCLLPQIAEAVNSGKLVPESIIFGLLSKRLENGHYRGETGFILDGIPRTRLQAVSLLSSPNFTLLWTGA